MKEIELTKGMVALVDDEDYAMLMSHKWRSMKSKNGTLYAVRNVQVNGKWGSILMHRLVMDAPPGTEVDHINMNTLDNRKENLRVCSRSENSCNRPANANNTSGYKGVSWDKRNKKWVAQIRRDKKIIHIGYYDDAEEAARAYDEKAKGLFREFAWTNF